jgi:ribosome-binding factor A
METPSKKQLQIAGLIQKEFSKVLQQEGSPIYGAQALVTVTRVRMSQDFGIAYIYLSIYNTPDKEAILKLLWENHAKLRGVLGKRIASQMRHIPVPKFFIDDTVDQMIQVDQLFARINQEHNSNRSMREVMDERRRMEEEKQAASAVETETVAEELAEDLADKPQA